MKSKERLWEVNKNLFFRKKINKKLFTSNNKQLSYKKSKKNIVKFLVILKIREKVKLTKIIKNKNKTLKVGQHLLVI